MKFFRVLARSIRDSFKGVFRNFALSLASISSITVTLFVVSVSVLLTYNVNNFAELAKKELTIVAFLESDLSDIEINNIENKLNRIKDVETYNFKSKQDIANEMMESSEELKIIMENWTEEDNPLNDTFEIKVTQLEVIDAVADQIRDIEGIKSLQYGEEMVKPLIAIFDVVKNISIGAVGALILVTAFLISNTIKITIFSRRREIEIMRLVGASNWNIRIPFLFEGLILGVLGSIIPIVLTIYGYNALYDNFDGQVFSPFIKLISPSPFVFQVSAILLTIGILVGMFGSVRAVRKHLKI